jgi:hypothetical protein
MPDTGRKIECDVVSSKAEQSRAEQSRALIQANGRELPLLRVGRC